MKPKIILIFIIVTFCLTAQARDAEKRSGINLKLSHGILWQPEFVFEYSVDPGIEFLFHKKLPGRFTLSYGAGLSTGRHDWTDKYMRLEVNEDGSPRKVSIMRYNRHTFFDISIPVYLEASLNSKLFTSCFLGISPGYNLQSKYYRGLVDLVKEDTRFNRLFHDTNLGIKLRLLSSRNFTLDLAPYIGARLFFTDKNDWQYNFVSYGLKFCMDI